MADDKENESYSEIIHKIRDNFLCLGNFRNNESKYIEAYSFYLCAHNMAPSMLSAFMALESFCDYIGNSSSYKEEHKLTKENTKTILDWFNECLKITKAEGYAWKGQECERDLVLSIHEDILEKTDENREDIIINRMFFCLRLRRSIKVERPIVGL